MSDAVKLIIEIPKAMYESVQNGTYCGNLYKELKNGTPLNNNYTVSNEYVDYQDRVGADMKEVSK